MSDITKDHQYDLFLYMILFTNKDRIGKSFSYLYTSARRRFISRKRGPNRKCYMCNRHLSRKDISIDHIIPVSLCRILGRYDLIVDTRNFLLSCFKCNLSRAHRINSVYDLKLDIGQRVVDSLILGSELNDESSIKQPCQD